MIPGSGRSAGEGIDYPLQYSWASPPAQLVKNLPAMRESMEFSRPEYWSGQPFPSPGSRPNPRIEPRSPALQADSLPAEPQGKPKNTGVGNLSLLQQIFLTQESNWGLLHCRQILYQLSYQGRPIIWAFILFGDKGRSKTY